MDQESIQQKNEKMLTIPEAIEVTKKPESFLYNLIRKGKIKAVKSREDKKAPWLIPESEIQKIENHAFKFRYKYRKYDILAALIYAAEKAKQTKQEPRSMRIPYPIIADCLRNGQKIAPDTVLKFLEKYEKERLLIRQQGRPLIIKLHGNAWQKINDTLRSLSPEIDQNTKLFEWCLSRFVRDKAITEKYKKEAIEKIKFPTIPSFIPSKREEPNKIEFTISLSPQWLKIISAFSSILTLLGEELESISKKIEIN